MSEWNEVRLGDLCAFVSRGITPQYVDEGIPVINQKCIRNNKVDLSLCKHTNTAQKIKNEKYVQYGDILVNSTGTGTLGRVAIYKHHVDKISADGHVTILHTNQNADPIYLGYYLHSVEPLIENLGRGTTNQLELSPSDLKRIKIVLPDLHTQKRIADVLSGYDDLIENNNRRIALLEKAAQELYKEWFVCFRFPGYRTAKFENGLPEGWEYIRFGKAIEIIDGDRGVNYPKQEEFYETGECLFLNAGNVTKNGFDFSSCSYITKEKDQVLRKGKLQTGDVVLTTRGTVGNVAFLNETLTFAPMRINSGMVILRNLDIVSPEYIYTTLRHEGLQKAMMMYASGSAQPQLPIKDMRRIKIIKPDDVTMERFTEFVSPIYKQISSLIMKNQTISKQRDLLLPRLMSGKLEV